MIIIAPYARGMRNGAPHPKNYPFWKEVLAGIDEKVIQVGSKDEEILVPTDCFKYDLPLSALRELVEECRTWISVDSFFQHFCWDLNKPGIVIFSQSDPNIFGHPENINLLKDRKYLREKQYWLWEQADYIEDAFVSPEVVLNALKT